MIGSMGNCADQVHNPSRGPLSVRYACGLLQVQAGLWAVAGLGMALWIISIAMNGSPIARTHSHAAWVIVAGLGLIVVCGLCAGSGILAAVLASGSARARVAAIVLESCMVPFGWVFANYTATGQGFIDAGPPAGLVGGALSLAAAIALLSKHARRFTTRDKQAAGPAGWFRH